MKSSAKIQTIKTLSVFSLLGATLIGVSLGACTVTTDGGSLSDFDAGELGSDVDSGTTTSTPGNPVCNSCLFQGCSGQHAVCQASAECLAIYQCAIAPNCDANCVSACFAAHPLGQNEYTALYTCDQHEECASCSSQCGVASCADASTPDAAVEVDAAPAQMDCSTCTATRCSSEQTACAPGTDCDAYSSCVLPCGDASCTSACGTAHVSGKAASDALATCTTTNCKTECGL